MSSTTYYDYQHVKVMIAKELMKRADWKVYGFKPDESDMMTDYYSPADWGGIAVKHGFVLVVDKSWGHDEQTITRRVGKASEVTAEVNAKIRKLEKMTVDHGATQAEEDTAKEMISKLRSKADDAVKEEVVEIVDVIPAYQQNPPRCNWHIEKDGIIIAKGTGLLKYVGLTAYFYYGWSENDDREKAWMMRYKSMSEEEFVDYYCSNPRHWNYNIHNETDAANYARQMREEIADDEELFDSFIQLLGKWDSLAGSMVGNAEFEYEKKTVTEYRKENKVRLVEHGGVKDGQCFKVLGAFTYGTQGHTYRIVKEDIATTDGKPLYSAYKLNGKLTKVCKGKASRNNIFFYMTTAEKLQQYLTKWIPKSISWAEIVEEKVPYEVEKVIKKPVKNPKTDTAQDKAEKKEKENFTVVKSRHTKTGDDIWLVKWLVKLERNDYINLAEQVKEKGGYYSRFTHSFVFREDPTELMRNVSVG